MNENSIGDYLTEKQKREIAHLSNRNKLLVALKVVKAINPSAKFNFVDIAKFLEIPSCPGLGGGIVAMARMIHEYDEGFPIDMIVLFKTKKSLATIRKKRNRMCEFKAAKEILSRWGF